MMRAYSSGTALIQAKHAGRRKSRKLARKVSKRLPESGTQSSHQVGKRVMATAFSGDSKTTFFHGWARGPSAKLRHPRCLQCCIESKAEALSRPPTAPCRTADRYFAML